MAGYSQTIPNRMQCLLPMDHPIAIENIRRRLSPAELKRNCIPPNVLEDIKQFAFTRTGGVRKNANGTVFIYDDLDLIVSRYSSLMDEIMPGCLSSPCVSGNFFITPQQYGLHTDSITKHDFEESLKRVPLSDPMRRYTVWKNILIPLWLGGEEDIDGGQILFFDQRHIDWSHVYNHGNATKSIATTYPIADDYSKLDFYDGQGHLMSKDLKPFDKEIHDRYLITPIKRLTGLSTEAVLDWTPGDAMVFDAVQLHATNRGSKHLTPWYCKMGLLLCFIVELDEDLLHEWRLIMQW